MYRDSNKTDSGLMEWLKVGQHQGSALSQRLFITVLVASTRELSGGSPWKLVYAVNLL
jgi:hypothetical protein